MMWIIIAIGVAVVGVIVTVLCVYNSRHSDRLYGEWIQVCTSDEVSPSKIIIDKGNITQLTCDEKLKSTYTVDNVVGFDGICENAKQIVFKNNLLFERLIYHTEKFDGEEIEIISGTVFELDGRGEVVFQEFVRSDIVSKLPNSFESEFAEALNSTTPVPTYTENVRFDEEKAYKYRRTGLIAGADCYITLSNEDIVTYYSYADYPKGNEAGMSDLGADIYFVGLKSGEVEAEIKINYPTLAEPYVTKLTLNVDENLVVTCKNTQ